MVNARNIQDSLKCVAVTGGTKHVTEVFSARIF